MGENGKVAAGNEYLLEVEGLSKSFGGTKALQNVQLRIKRGEVHALVGENGAGKSTLMKAIIGLHKADSGTITFEGQPYKVSGPAEAMKKGVSMIHQELNPEPHLTIAENIFLHREDTKGIILSNCRDETKHNQGQQTNYQLTSHLTNLILGFDLQR
jgi:ribose transport system ATP-binding protein/inositol transport system ATP-binding protein